MVSRRVLLLLSLLAMASKCQSASRETAPTAGVPIRAEAFKQDLDVFGQAPHPMGSPRNAAVADYLEQSMKSAGLETARDPFTVEVPDPELLGLYEASAMRKTTLPLSLANVTARYASGKARCAYIVSSHFDSKRLPQGGGIGANDSGSSSVVLLELMRTLVRQKPDYRCSVIAVWFDGEEAYLPEWRDGETKHPARIVDNTYGCRPLPDQLTKCVDAWCLPNSLGAERLEGLILLDMVGLPNLKISPESNSDRGLSLLAKTVDKESFGGRLYASGPAKNIEDDHIPFVSKGVPSLDIIGFEDLSTWHQPSDTNETLSTQSLIDSTQFTYRLLERILVE